MAFAALGVLCVAPSAGHLYAGEPGHAALTSVGRAFFTGIFLSSVIHSEEGDGDRTASTVLGAAGYLGLTVYDWIDAKNAVLRERARARVVVAPMVPSGDRGATGLVVAGSF